MSEGPSIQYRPPHKGEAGFGFEDGQSVPTGEAEIFTDEPPANGESAQLPPLGLDLNMAFSLIIRGSKDSQERDARLLILAMKYEHPDAPKSKTELAAWLNIPRSSVDRLWERVSQCLQGEIASLRKSRTLINE
jgi:hypothetical protein